MPTETTPLLCPSSIDNSLTSLPVYYHIHRVYEDIKNNIDVGMTFDQLHSPEIAFHIIHPLEAEYAETGDASMVFVLLLNRLEFIRDRDSAMSSYSLNQTRADLCELLATRLLRHQATSALTSSAGLLAMSTALVGGFRAFQGADQKVIDKIREKEGYTARMVQQGAGETNALELAILSEARHFIKSQATQRVITAIWEGKIVYSASSFLDILPDRWKLQGIGLYKISNAPILDHYRLRVPKYRSIIEFFSFSILFISFLAVVIDRRNRHEHLPVSALSWKETWFFIYTLGYSLDRIASVMEHGWSVYSAGLTNGLDALCLPIFGISFGFRMLSVIKDDAWAADQAFAVLSCAACLMFPRLVFALIKSNVLILSLRAMLADFAWLMGVAVFCFLGFVFALNHLGDGDYSVSRISEYLIFIWFGLDGKGIDLSGDFHPILGPILMITYAALSNTLLVSLLVAILSTTYSEIAADAAAEDMFRRAVRVFEGVKCDSLFDYVPPLNLVALGIMYPISKVVSPRWFHKINVATTRLLSLPILLLIALYERLIIRKYLSGLRTKLAGSLPNSWSQRLNLLEGAHWEARAVFQYSPRGEKSNQDDEDYDSNSNFSAEDEVEDAVREMNKSGRAITRIVSGNRASIVITPPPPPSTKSNVPPPAPAPILVKERLPANATAHATIDDSALSTSPHNNKDSILSKLYHATSEDHTVGIRRRNSLFRSSTIPVESSNASLEAIMAKLDSMNVTIASLEARLKEKDS